MTTIVLKFGGSSLANKECIDKVMAIVLKYKNRKYKKIIVVMSAVYNWTNKIAKLIEMQLQPQLFKLKTMQSHVNNFFCEIEQLNNTMCSVNLNPEFELFQNTLFSIKNKESISSIEFLKKSDILLAMGEIMTARMITKYMQMHLTCDIKYMDSRQFMKGNSNFTNADITPKFEDTIAKQMSTKFDIAVTSGFVGSTHDTNETITFGRNGGDYSACVIGTAMKCEIVIYTNVDGILTADPRIVPNAQLIKSLTKNQAMELTTKGGKVLHNKALMVCNRDTNLKIKNTFNDTDDKCTTILFKHTFEQQSTNATNTTNITNATTNDVIGVYGLATVYKYRIITPRINQSNNMNCYQKQLSHTYHTIQTTDYETDCEISLQFEKDNNLLFMTKNMIANEHDYYCLKKIENSIRIPVEYSIVSILINSNAKKINILSASFNAIISNNSDVEIIHVNETRNCIDLIIKKEHFDQTIKLLHQVFIK